MKLWNLDVKDSMSWFVNKMKLSHYVLISVFCVFICITFFICLHEYVYFNRIDTCTFVGV